MNKILLILIGACYGVALVGALTQRYHLLPFKVAFGAVVLGFLGAAIVAMVALGGLVFSSGRRAFIAPLVVALVPLAALLLSLAPRLKAPLVNDVSTRGGVVAFEHAPSLRGDADNMLEPAPPETYPDLVPLALEWQPVVVYAAATAEARALGWTITATDPPHRFEAVSYTTWMRFADDVVVVIAPTSDGSLVRMRSASRVGRGDLGQNARRIQQFFVALRARLAAAQS